MLFMPTRSRKRDDLGSIVHILLRSEGHNTSFMKVARWSVDIARGPGRTSTYTKARDLRESVVAIRVVFKKNGRRVVWC